MALSAGLTVQQWPASRHICAPNIAGSAAKLNGKGEGMSDDQYDLLESLKRRDEGEALVTENQSEHWREGYKEHAEAFLASMPPGCDFIGEDMRRHIFEEIGAPTHHNAWGALAGTMIRRWTKEGRIELVGLGKMTDRTSHARLSPRYRVRVAALVGEE
jgi:hypothetical protein